MACFGAEGELFSVYFKVMIGDRLDMIVMRSRWTGGIETVAGIIKKNGHQGKINKFCVVIWVAYIFKSRNLVELPS